MRRSLSLVFGLALGLLALAAPVVAQTGYAPDAEESAFLGLINDYRAQNGLGLLVLNDALGAAAKHHSFDMATNDYVGHTLADGTDPGQNIANFGYSGSTWSENVAAGYAGAQDNLIAWQNSPGHNANMLGAAFDEVGIGRAFDANSTFGWYWTTTFGGSSATEDVPPVAESSTPDEGNTGAAPVGETATWTWTVVPEEEGSANGGTDGSVPTVTCDETEGTLC